jgi:hypothetical protein
MQNIEPHAKVRGRDKATLTHIQMGGTPVLDHDLNMKVHQARIQPPAISHIQFPFKLHKDLVTHPQETVIGGHCRMCVTQQSHQDTTIAPDLGPSFHPGLGQVARKIPEGVDVPWCNGTILRVPTKFKGICPAVLIFQYGTGHSQSGIVRCNAERQQSCAHFKIGSPRKPKVLESHHLCRCDFKGRDILCCTGCIHQLLNDPTGGDSAASPPKSDTLQAKTHNCQPELATTNGQRWLRQTIL